MPLLLRDAAALLIALGATGASLVAWSNGTVTLGLELAEDDGRVHVTGVASDSHAMWNGWHHALQLLDVTTVDGSQVDRGEPVRGVAEGSLWVGSSSFNPIEWLFGSVGRPLVAVGQELRLPAEAMDPARIETALGGDILTEPRGLVAAVYAALDRTLLELELRSSIGILAVGAALGLGVWSLLRRGVAGHLGAEHAVVLGCAAATPFLVMPLVQVGTTAGIAAGFGLPAAVALIFGVSLARLHPEDWWRQAATAASVVTAGLAVLLLSRYVAFSANAPDGRGSILLLIAAISLAPAVVAASAAGHTLRQRLGLLSLALVPAAAHTVVGPRPDVFVPTVLVSTLVGWQLLPVGRALSAIERRVPRTAEDSRSASRDAVGRISARTRNVAAIALFAALLLGTTLIGYYDAWAAVVGLGLAALVWFAVRQAFLGPGWGDAAVPLAVAVGTPIVLMTSGSLFDNDLLAWIFTAIALAGLPVAHGLADRYPDPAIADRLWWSSVALLPFVLIGSLAVPEAIGFVAALCIPLVPGLPLAFARRADDASGVSTRLETMAVALTPAAAATMLVPLGFIIFGSWLVALVVWKYATVTPLLRFAERTQLQRDLAVAAAETERARLAADLHDDALQQLTMLVRKLDERGDAEVANEAREIADKLRAVVGDLRLPILDDLGAGAALEWLVERVEPLAGGPVKLERSDATRPPATVELAVFRVAQEALTNAIKHGRPPIEIRYDVRADGRVTLAVDDAGEGIDPDASEEAPRQGHFGLANMQQRAEQIGAILDVRRWPGGGTRVAFEWRPL
ncbi:MAG: hypothetical protein LC798_07420 [Chloroflexi bacterium]|nr:hypothetical protein [Chloroflexota bacterium]